VIKQSPIQYAMAYIYSEQDDNDLTYFIDYNIRKIKLAIKDFKEYVEVKSKENKQFNDSLKLKFHLNDRQSQLLQYLYKSEDRYTSSTMQMKIYQVTKKTAVSDLKSLEKMGLLKAKRIGRNIRYYATKKIKTVLG
jgi:Fic family protein